MATTNVPRRASALLSVAIAVLITIAVFPEVVFLGGSLSSVGLNDVLDSHRDHATVSVYPNPEDLDPRSGLLDVGARTWQFEPATKVMHRAIYDGESAYWNPYSAAGSFGPETLADMKESPFVLAVAALGATSTAFTLVMLAAVALSLYCLQQFFVRTLALSRLSAVAACVVFLLNGWAASVLTSQTSGPYLLFPVLLYAVTEYQRVGGRARFVLAVAAYVALFATTFLPTLFLVLLLVQAVALLLDIRRQRERHRTEPVLGVAYRVAARQLVVPLIAFGAVAFIWLPDLVAWRHGGSELHAYDQVDLTTRSPIEALWVLTPRQLYRWYVPSTLPPDLADASWTVYLGLVPLVVVASAVPRARGMVRSLLILLAGLGLFALAMHLGIPGIKLLAYLPGLRPISQSYWASLAGAALTLAFGVAVDVARAAGLSLRAGIVTGAIFIGCFALAVATRGASRTAGVFVTAAVVLVLLGVGIIWASHRWPTRRTWFAAGLVVLASLELLSYQNHQRVRRFDFEDQLPAYVTYVRDNVADGRILNVGRGGVYAEWGAALGIRQIETLNIMQLPWYRDFFAKNVNPDEGVGKFLDIGKQPGPSFSAAPAALDQLSVRYLVVDTRYATMDRDIAADYPLVFEDHEAGIRVYGNPDAFPRAYWSPMVTDTSNRPRVGRWRQNVTITDDAALLDEAHAAGLDSPDVAGAAEAATITEDGNDRVVVQVDAPQSGVLVLADAYQGDWRATVDGRPAHIGRVNDAFRGVVVPAGTSTVTFHYVSNPRRVGTVISLATVGLLIIGVAVAAGRAARERRRLRQLNERVDA